MVLLENFGAEPPTIKPIRFNCHSFASLLPGKVTEIMMPGIPKFVKRAIPKGPGTKKSDSSKLPAL